MAHALSIRVGASTVGDTVLSVDRIPSNELFIRSGSMFYDRDG
jgi:hypothetical protein